MIVFAILEGAVPRCAWLVLTITKVTAGNTVRADLTHGLANYERKRTAIGYDLNLTYR